MRAALCALIFCSSAVAAGEEATLAYRQAKYSIGAAGANNAMEWAYPVVLPAQTPTHRRLNAWLREQALEIFLHCELTAALDLKAMPDRKLVADLSADPDFAACGLLQAVIEPREAFGRYVTFELTTELGGGNRPLQGTQVLVFDMVSGIPMSLETLFKPGALDAINDALARQIAKDRSRPDCLGRPFKWSQVSLRPPADLFISFPYHPREWSECGDGVEALSGQVVSTQFLKPAQLRPVRRWARERP